MSATQTQRGTSNEQADIDAELAMAAASGAASSALRAGAAAPLFTLADTVGNTVALETLLNAGPVVLHFFRGAWCSFGERSLADFASTYEALIGLGASAVAIAPPNGPGVHSQPLPMPELPDPGMKVASAYGLAFELPLRLRDTYERLGYVPPSRRKAHTFMVPVPATYLLDRDGIVALAYIDVDYRKRLDSRSLLSALRAMQKRHTHAGSRRGARVRPFGQ